MHIGVGLVVQAEVVLLGFVMFSEVVVFGSIPGVVIGTELVMDPIMEILTVGDVTMEVAPTLLMLLTMPETEESVCVDTTVDQLLTGVLSEGSAVDEPIVLELTPERPVVTLPALEPTPVLDVRLL